MAKKQETWILGLEFTKELLYDLQANHFTSLCTRKFICKMEWCEKSIEKKEFFGSQSTMTCSPFPSTSNKVSYLSMHHPLSLTLLLTAIYFLLMALPGSSLSTLQTWVYFWLISFLPSLSTLKPYRYYFYSADPDHCSRKIAKPRLPASDLTLTNVLWHTL